MTSLQPQADQLIHHYMHLTGREARVQVYEYALWSFFQAGFTCDEFVLVLNFLLRENKRNKFQYAIRLGSLIQDHAKFMDLLGEAKAVERNRVKPQSPKQEILHAFRHTTPEPAVNFLSAKEVISRLKESSL